MLETESGHCHERERERWDRGHQAEFLVVLSIFERILIEFLTRSSMVRVSFYRVDENIEERSETPFYFIRKMEAVGKVTGHRSTTHSIGE